MIVRAVTIAPRDTADASPSVHPTSGTLIHGGEVTPSCASLAARDAGSPSSDGLPICSAVDTADWSTVGLARITTASSITTAVDGVASAYARSTAHASTVAMDGSDGATCPVVGAVIIVSRA